MTQERSYDVDAILNGGPNTRELLQVWEHYGTRRTWTDIRDGRRGEVTAETAETAARAIAEVPEVTALDALTASARLVDLLTGWRWLDVLYAREEGATWDQVGDVLKVSADEARAAYRAKLELREQYTGKFHDRDRARAVLDDQSPGTTSTQPLDYS